MQRHLLLCALLLFLLLLGLATLNRGLLALAAPLSIFLGAALFYGPEQLRLKVTRTLSDDRVYQGTPVVIRILITNEGEGLEEVLVEDLRPRSLDLVNGEPRVLASLPPGGTVQLEYSVLGKRGSFTFTNVRVIAGDHLGILRRQAMLSAPGQFTVLPNPLKLKRLAIRPLQTKGYAGPVPARQGGSGVEFFGVREYRLGDPRNWVNWRLSARHPRGPFTNQFEMERIADVGLILDARRVSDVRFGENALFEYAVRAAASLAEVFLNDGNRVGLLIYGAIPRWIFPGYGRFQRKKILDALVRAETGESGGFTTLDYLPTRLFPPRSQIVMISPLLPGDVSTLVRLRAHGYQILVVSPDPVDFELKALGIFGAKVPQQHIESAARIARLERKLVLRRLRQADIQTVDWKVHTLLGQSIHSAVGRLPHRFRPVSGET